MIKIRDMKDLQEQQTSASLVAMTLRCLAQLGSERLPKGLTTGLITRIEEDSPETAGFLNRAHMVMLEDWAGANEQCQLAVENWEREFSDLLD